MTTDFGLDLSSAEDVDATRTVSGVELVAEDALWRLKTETGMGILQADAPTYGFDLEGEIGKIDSPSGAAALPGKIRSALLDDERIESVDATITRIVNGPAVEYQIAIHCETALGPFELVGFASDEGLSLNVKLLPGGI